MDRKEFKVNKRALILIGLTAGIAGLILPVNRNESDGFLTTNLIVQAFIIAMLGGAMSVIVSYFQYSRGNKS